MTIAPERLESATAEAPQPATATAAEGAPGSPESSASPKRRTVNATPVAAAAALASLAVAWTVGGLFDSWAARALGVAGVLIGAGVVWYAVRHPRFSIAQFAALPVAAVVGAALVAPSTGHGASLVQLITDAASSGNLRQPPIPLDPGWRFILVVLLAAISAAAAGVGIGLGRPKLAVMVPLPLVIAAAFAEPPGTELVTTAGVLVLLISALSLAYGADLAADGIGGTGFELRRLRKAVGLLAVILAVVVVVARTGILFPPTNQDQVIPPHKPPIAPVAPDHELFTVHTKMLGPWRLGTLDIYDGTDWLLPAQNPASLVPLTPGRPVPDAVKSATTVTVPITVTDLSGRGLPVPGGLVSLTGGGGPIRIDPDTGVPSLGGRVPGGYSYTVVAETPPNAAELEKAGAEPPGLVKQFAAVPPPPPTVVQLLSQAPSNLYDRLQFLRNALYNSVVAAGAGTPTSVTPVRVEQMLHRGTTATPYEITAAEALLGRWAGLPARMGYGYYGGQATRDGFSLHPRNGAAWLEVYFSGHGWVPLVGTPTKAQSNLSNNDSNSNPSVHPSEDLSVTVFIAYREPGLVQLFEVIRYWLLVALPFVTAGVLGWLGVAPLAKALRRRRRARWALRYGPPNRVLAAYAEFRDRCQDLNVGEVRHTPLQHLASIEGDDEHRELAWLVTRALWGDLRRDVNERDAVAAETLAASVTRRVAGEQSMPNRLLALVSRASLRDPFNDDVPNLWFALRWRRRLGVRLRVPRPRRLAGAAAATAGIAVLLSGCGAPPPSTRLVLPPRVAPPPPAQLLGLTFPREPVAEQLYRTAGTDSLMSAGEVFAIEQGTLIQGTIQVALFKPEVDTSSADVQAQVESQIGGDFTVSHVGELRINTTNNAELTLVLWFPPDQNAMVLFSFRKKYAAPDETARAVLAYIHGWPVTTVAGASTVPLPAPPSAAPASAAASPSAPQPGVTPSAAPSSSPSAATSPPAGQPTGSGSSP